MSVHNSGKLSFSVMYNLFKADAHKNSFVRAGHKGGELSPSQLRNYRLNRPVHLSGMDSHIVS